eukprot:4284829-Amphidinium_carterae.1
MTCRWQHLGRCASHLHETPSGHLLVSIMDMKKWKPPDMLFLTTDEEARPMTILYQSSHTCSSDQQSNRVVNVGTSSCQASPTTAAQPRTKLATTDSSCVEQPAQRMGLAHSGEQDAQHLASMSTNSRMSQLPTSTSGGIHGPVHPTNSQQYFIDGIGNSEPNTTIESDRGTSHGDSITTQRRTSGTMRSSHVPTCRCPTQTEEQRSPLVVDMHCVREPMATNRVHTTTASWQGSADDWTPPRHTLRSDPSDIQSMGDQGNGGAWQWHAPAVTAFCTMVDGAGDSTTAGGSRCYLVGNSAKPADSRGRRGHGIHSSTPGSGSIGAVRSRTLLHELQHVVFPQQRRLQQRQFGGGTDVKGVLLGLYTRQGGTGVTKATLRYPHLVKLLTDLSRHMGWQHTSVQINVLDSMSGPNTSVGLHLDKFNSPDTSSHMVVLGDFVGGKFWLEDDEQSGAARCKPPPHLCLGQEPPTEVLGRWHEITHGQWLEFLPTRWHGTDLVTRGVRFSCSFFTPGGLHRVSSSTWAQLQALRFNVHELALPSRTVLSLASWASQRLQEDAKQEPSFVLSQMELEPPFSLRSGKWLERDCLWLLLAACDNGQPYQRRWKHSALDLQRLGFVTVDLPDHRAREEMSEIEELPEGSFHVLLLISPDTYFPMSENDEEVSALPRAVRRSNLNSLSTQLTGIEFEKQVALPLWNAPENYPALDEELDVADDPDEEPGNENWEPTEAELRSLQLAHNNLGHPINADFCRLLRRGGARPEV